MLKIVLAYFAKPYLQVVILFCSGGISVDKKMYIEFHFVNTLLLTIHFFLHFSTWEFLNTLLLFVRYS